MDDMITLLNNILAIADPLSVKYGGIEPFEYYYPFALFIQNGIVALEGELPGKRSLIKIIKDSFMSNDLETISDNTAKELAEEIIKIAYN